MILRPIVALFFVMTLCAAPPAQSQVLQGEDEDPALVASVPYQPPSGARYTVFISDLHFGVGRRSDGRWHPMEDFRWPNALRGFLDKISEDGQGRVDLVIVGDFLELWQPPTKDWCKGLSADIGCTLEEMESLTSLVARAHSDGLGLLRAFAERADNRLHIIPGNHDATLRYARVWRPVGEALNATSGRINLATDGVWASADSRIVAEHGHQIGQDVNRYETWPRIARQKDRVHYIIRPWGELFVQKLFNEQEETYSIIDNLSPETAGARYRAADRGVWGSASDVARMLLFNLWETSPWQKEALLGPGSSDAAKWDVRIARGMGADLFINALPANDPFAIQLGADDPDARAVKAELAALAHDPSRLPDETVLHLCDLIAAAQKKQCSQSDLGSIAQSILQSREKVLARHLRDRQKQFKSMQVFIYGHTHSFETSRPIKLNDLVSVTVANTGAFQRLIDEAGFLRRLNGEPPEVGLRKLQPEDLPPCYAAVIVKAASANPEVVMWRMGESGPGRFVSTKDVACQ